MVHLTGPDREAPGSGRRQKKQGKTGVKVLIVDYHGNDWTRKAEQQGTLDNRILQLWQVLGIEVVSSYICPWDDLGLGDNVPACRSLMKGGG